MQLVEIIRGQKDKSSIRSCFENLKSTPTKEYPSLIDDFLPYIETNMSSMDMIKLATERCTISKRKFRNS